MQTARHRWDVGRGKKKDKHFNLAESKFKKATFLNVSLAHDRPLFQSTVMWGRKVQLAEAEQRSWYQETEKQLEALEDKQLEMYKFFLKPLLNATLPTL